MRGAAFFTLVLVTALLGACNSAQIWCTPDETMCHGSCSALYKDPQNCGACDVACGAGLVCSQGMCTTSCAPGLEQCGSSCVETFIDRENCGGCGHLCGAGEVCSKGGCTSTCVQDQKLCIAHAAYCANILSDNANCGDCGVRCPPKLYCVSGACESSCGEGQTVCEAECVNLKSDADHCGACSTFCVLGQHCIDGACACPEGQTACGSACTDTSTDKNNCGSCGQKCTGTCEGARCASVFAYTSAVAQALAQDSTSVYWIQVNGEVHQETKSMSSYQVMASNAYTASVAVDGSYVYWPSGAAIEVADINGSTASEQTVPNDAGEVTTDGNYVYVADSTGIRRFPSGGGTVASIVTDTKPHALATSSGMIFWSNDAYQLQSANADGTSQSTLATMTSAIDHVVTDGTNVYFTWGSYILSVPLASTSPPLALVSGLVGLLNIATDGSYVYWIDSKSISKVPVTGGATTKLHTSSGDARQIVVDGSAVYWTSTSSWIGKLSPK